MSDTPSDPASVSQAPAVQLPEPADPQLLDKAHKQVDRLFRHFDWQVLGEVYCEVGGDAFWAVNRGPARRSGIALGRALAERLQPGGTSLWVGAGVAELGALVFETLVRERRVVATNLRAAECEVLDHAIAAVGMQDQLSVQSIDAGSEAERLAAGDGFDHLGMVSVLTDPERFPTVAGVTYGRLHPVLVDIEAFERERAQAREESSSWFAGLSMPGLVTTTVEEVPWVLDWCDRNQRGFSADEQIVESAVVGDPIGFLRMYEKVGGAT